jgi:hypothetical protein
MSDKLILEINLEELTRDMGDISKELASALEEGAESLSTMTHAKVLELANEKLDTREKTYKENVTFEEIEKNIWVVTLLEPAMWIEEGREPGSMVEDLLRNNPKINQDGKRYKVIPFEHSKEPSQQSPQALELVGQIKQHLKKEKIPFRKLELGPTGSPRIGLLHRFSLPSDRPTEKAKDPALKNVTIYQKKDKAAGAVRRDVLTFRTVTEGHRDEGKWFHPGLERVGIFDDAFEWAVRTWENEVMPDILASVGKGKT